MWIETWTAPAARHIPAGRFIPRKRGMWIETRYRGNPSRCSRASSPGNGGCGLKHVPRWPRRGNGAASSPGNGGCGLKPAVRARHRQRPASFIPRKRGMWIETRVV